MTPDAVLLTDRVADRLGTAPATSTAIAGPGYLPRGQTGSRDEVPWSAVGAGWRLLLPATGAQGAGRSTSTTRTAAGT